MSDLAKITCAKLLADRPTAIQIKHKGVTCWPPRSQIEYLRKQGGEVTIEIPHWLAEAKGLDYE